MIEIIVPIKLESLNKTLRMHWSARSKIKKEWIQTLSFLSLSGRKRIKSKTPFKNLKIISIRKRRLDVDNFHGGCKSAIDAIKELKWIVDDSPKHINLEFEQKLRKNGERENTIVRLW